VSFPAPTFSSLTVVETAAQQREKSTVCVDVEQAALYTGNYGLSRKKCWTEFSELVILLGRQDDNEGGRNRNASEQRIGKSTLRRIHKYESRSPNKSIQGAALNAKWRAVKWQLA
jgi:hypothetical protein